MKKLLVAISAVLVLAGCTNTRNEWESYLNPPKEYQFEKADTLIAKYEFWDFSAELLVQSNGLGTTQRVLKVFPQEYSGKLPAVVVPFYFPEAMIGQELDTQIPLDDYSKIAMMADLARRGFACISADSYHLTYADCELERGDFKRWKVASDKLLADYPSWCGMGKLVADTELLVDLLEKDPRIDADRIGIAGHSLGGKIAFYTGCLDPRIKVLLLSDFGFLWDQSNWEAQWYWGNKLEELKSKGMDHRQLLSLASDKPVCLLAGLYDNEESEAAMKEVSDNVTVINHQSGHRPPTYALEEGYNFMEYFLTLK